MKQKRTILVGRMVLETAEIEVEVDDPDELEGATLLETADLDGVEFNECRGDNWQTAPFIVGTADHLMLREAAMDELPTKQKSLEDMIRDDLDHHLQDFAVTAAIADLSNGEGNIVHSEWMGDPNQPDLLISDIATDWLGGLSGLTGPADKANELLKDPEAMERYHENLDKVFGDTIRDLINQKPSKPH